MAVINLVMVYTILPLLAVLDGILLLFLRQHSSQLVSTVKKSAQLMGLEEQSIPVVFAMQAVFLWFLSWYSANIWIAYVRTDGYDNSNPRAQPERKVGFAARMHAASENTLEQSVLFLVSVCCAHHCQVTQDTVVFFGTLWVLARIAYVGLYAANLATLRSTVFIFGELCTVCIISYALFGQSAIDAWLNGHARSVGIVAS